MSTRDAVQALNTYYWVFATDFLPGVDVVAHNLAECLAAAATETPVNDLSYLHIAGQSYRLLLERLRGSVSGCAITTEVLRAAGGFPAGRTCARRPASLGGIGARNCRRLAFGKSCASKAAPAHAYKTCSCARSIPADR